jgi:hypothetical protein
MIIRFWNSCNIHWEFLPQSPGTTAGWSWLSSNIAMPENDRKLHSVRCLISRNSIPMRTWVMHSGQREQSTIPGVIASFKSGYLDTSDSPMMLFDAEMFISERSNTSTKS